MDSPGRRCRFYRTPRLPTSDIRGNLTCEKGITYVSLLPTPEARGSGWVRRLPCIQLGAMPTIPGGSPCAHYLEETKLEHFAQYEPLRRVGDALEGMQPDQARALNADKAKLADFMDEHKQLRPGEATLVTTAEHVSLVCTCSARTDLPRDVGAAFGCSSCGKGYRLRFVRELGDYRLVPDT